ncbi:MAG: 4-alpha-glucanotransferase [Lachnospiraceae bacterium]|nr:4-alpha-glucanotransferase [Lachnospiraceae bacterium]
MRTCGILLPVSSLPSPYGIGCFSKEAYAFIDQLSAAGQTYWQILPLGPTGYGDSPYQSFSAFAGNPYFIDLDTLAAEGLLEKSDYENLDFGTDEASVDYAKLYQNRFLVLKQAFRRAEPEKNEEFQQFCETQKSWLADYSLYMAVKNCFGGKSWDEWDEEIRMRHPGVMACYQEMCREEILFYCFLQYEFAKQWTAVKAYANERGIRIIGDIPIYVSFDSSDSWANPQLFQFNDERRPLRVAGCPPDAFSADGQLWGNPLYNWEYHKKTGFAWWLGRLEHCFSLYDVVRVDHFRGFDEYFAIPYEAGTAAGGRWQPGPGMDFFRAVKAHFEQKFLDGELRIIAEDLGYLTESVERLVAETGYPGMKVMEFAFDSREAGDYMPYNYTKNCVVYTGTHDNQTLAAWYDELTEEDRFLAAEYLSLKDEDRSETVWAFVRLTLESVADTAIIPMQDYLCLREEARMNHPSTLGSNWKWRLRQGQFTDELAGKIRRINEVYGRLRK